VFHDRAGIEISVVRVEMQEHIKDFSMCHLFDPNERVSVTLTASLLNLRRSSSPYKIFHTDTETASELNKERHHSKVLSLSSKEYPIFKSKSFLSRFPKYEKTL
jgi:hypothetical protein